MSFFHRIVSVFVTYKDKERTTAHMRHKDGRAEMN